MKYICPPKLNTPILIIFWPPLTIVGIFAACVLFASVNIRLLVFPLTWALGAIQLEPGYSLFGQLRKIFRFFYHTQSFRQFLRKD